jgi:hypothetical protein
VHRIHTINKSVSLHWDGECTESTIPVKKEHCSFDVLSRISVVKDPMPHGTWIALDAVVDPIFLAGVGRLE